MKIKGTQKDVGEKEDGGVRRGATLACGGVGWRYGNGCISGNRFNSQE